MTIVNAEVSQEERKVAARRRAGARGGAAAPFPSYYGVPCPSLAGVSRWVGELKLPRVGETKGRLCDDGRAGIELGNYRGLNGFYTAIGR